MARLQLILAESALERVPEELWKHPAVTAHARRRAKRPEQTILDRSYHHDAMKRLGIRGSKRGRPDIVHTTLLNVLGSPLDREGLLDVYVHTWQDHVIRVSPEARLPRNYDRFVGLIEQLYETKVVPPGGERLLELRVQTLHALLEELRPDRTVAFSTLGKARTIRAVFAENPPDKTAVLIGGFPRGHLRSEHEKLAGEVVAVDRESIDAWVIAGRVVYEFECAIGTDKKRLE